jgi:hypothetical protein
MKMTWLLAAALAALALMGCPPGDTNTNKKDSGTPDSGGDAPNPYNYYALDPQASELKPLAMAITADDRIGVAYFVSVDGGVDAGLLNPSDAGSSGATVLQNYEIRYAEFKNGVAAAPQVVATVQLVYGLSLAFQASGEPAVAHLGGGSDQSVYWLQSDAAVSYRSGATWTERVAADHSNQAVCGNALSDGVGFLVGLNPALVFDGASAYLAYRDCHNGQFPQQDWAASDLEVINGGPTSWNRPLPPICGGNNKNGYGGHLNMVMAGAQPALVSDQVLGSADGVGSHVLFQMRKTDGTWTAPKDVMTNGNNQSGPSLAWDSQAGFGVAAVERSTNELLYTASADGITWQMPDSVYQTGSGGWWPSVSFDPVNHEPAIAFYICSQRNGVNESACLASEDSLHIRQLIAGNWQDQLVDEGGGYLPKIGHLSSGKRVVAYRMPATSATPGVLRLAVEK